ncbi:MAG: LapA family protein [Castellaniella sp.]
MRFLVWILRLAVFIVILLFALNNTSPVDVKLFSDHIIPNVPLIVVMLVSLVAGTVLGWFIAMPTMLKSRREVSRLRREQSRLEEKIDRISRQAPQPAAAATVAPVAPL